MHSCMHAWISGWKTKSAGVIPISYLVSSHHSYSGFDTAYQKFSHRLVLLNPASRNKDHLFRCSWKRSPEVMDLISPLIILTKNLEILFGTSIFKIYIFFCLLRKWEQIQETHHLHFGLRKYGYTENCLTGMKSTASPLIITLYIEISYQCTYHVSKT